MGRVIAYLRVSTNKQDVDNQKYGIIEYCAKNGIEIDEFIKDVITGDSEFSDRNFQEMYSSLREGDTLIVGELSRITRDFFDTIHVAEFCFRNKIALYCIKEDLSITPQMSKKDLEVLMRLAIYGLSNQLEKNKIVQRTKESYFRKRDDARKAGEKLKWGRNEGQMTTPEKRKLFPHKEKIMELHEAGKSNLYIAGVIGSTHVTVGKFIRDMKKIESGEIKSVN
jgi:putative DNA-invertase from lambdoid prophage Rac